MPKLKFPFCALGPVTVFYGRGKKERKRIAWELIAVLKEEDGKWIFCSHGTPFLQPSCDKEKMRKAIFPVSRTEQRLYQLMYPKGSFFGKLLENPPRAL